MLSYLFLLLAQDITLPKEVKVKPAEFIIIEAKTDNPNVKFVLLSEGIKPLERKLIADNKTFIGVSATEGRYKLLAYTAKADVPSDPAFTDIIVSNEDEKPINPDVSAIKTILESVYGADSSPDKSKSKQSMTEGFAEVLKNIETAKTVKDFDNLVKKYVSPKLKQGEIPAVRSAISDYLKSNIGSNGQNNLDQSKAKTILNQLISILNQL